jgi:hypothetical protein
MTKTLASIEGPSSRNNENRQEFDVCNRDNLRHECLFKLYLPMKTTVKDVIRLIAERIEYSQEQIILQKPARYRSFAVCASDGTVFSSFSSMSISSNISSASSLPISSDQTLRDLYLNTRSSMSSPRKIFFRRVTQKNFSGNRSHSLVLVTIQLHRTRTSSTDTHLLHKPEQEGRTT